MEAGSFWGRYGREAAKKVGPSGLLILIEPDPMSEKITRLVMKKEDIENVIFLQYAISDYVGSTPFVTWGNPAGHRMADPATIAHPEYGKCIINVQVITIDRIVEILGLKRIDLLACDVENQEIPLVKGAMNSFKSHIIHNVALATYHADHTSIPNHKFIVPLLESWGYKDLIYEDGVLYGHD